MIAAELLALLLAAAAAGPHDSGRRIYTSGSGSAGAIRASMGDGETVEASLVPCASCHGRDGRGRAEGGAVPSDIRRETLTRPYDVTSSTGRRHGPYDDRTLLRAITMGIDPAGNRLSNVMPRYQLARADGAALVAFLSTLGAQRDPGITDDEVAIGVLLPPSAEAAGDVRSSLTAWLEEINDGGGIYNRRIAIRFAQPGAEGADRVAKLRELSGTFALVAADTEGADVELADAAETIGIPMLTSISRSPSNRSGSYRQVFDLVAGIEEQSRALVRAALQDGTRRPLLLVGRSDAAAAEARRLGFERIELVGGAAIAEAVRGASGDSLLLVPSPLVHPIVFSEDNPLRTYVAFPMLPSKRSPRAQAALASAALFADALRRAGRDVSRASLIETLDTTTQLSSGYAPPVSFTAAHRIGSTGAYVIIIDRGTVMPPRWVD
jgi:ABC-type branched-subunit amino acid transport system substrate-binding protein